LERRAAVHGWRVGAGRAGGAGSACAGVLGLSTRPCSVVGCGAPVLPGVGLAFAGVSGTTGALLSGVSRVSALAWVLALVLAIVWLGGQLGARSRPSATLVESLSR